MRAWLVALAVCGAGVVSDCQASAETVHLDRVVARFVTRETGGPESPRFVFERELAFEARLEALASGDVHEGEPPFRVRHVRAALERHVTETVLSALTAEPKPTDAEVRARSEQARISLAERVGGIVPLTEAARAEGISDPEVSRLYRRQALASLYLERMVAPMLAPTDPELRAIHKTQRTPFSGRPYEEIRAPLERWYLSARLTQAVSAYYDGLRNRMTLSLSL